MEIVDNIKTQFKNGSQLIKIIYLNIGVFVLVQLLFIITNIVSGPDSNYWGPALFKWLTLPSNFIDFITKPWTLATYMFTHKDFFHLFSNLLILYFTGTVFQEYLGGKRLVTTYVGGGIFGAILYFAIYNITSTFGGPGILFGASAGVMAILIGLTFYVPNLPVKLFFVLEVKLWQVAVIFFLLDLSGIANFDNPGGRIAHVGGAIFGYLFVTQLRKGNDWSEKSYHFLNRLTATFKPKPKLKTVHRSATANKKKETSQNDQKRLDEILDKIKINGYENLSKDEKEFLFKFGNK